MKKLNAITLIALLILVVALPVYALLEPYRLDRAQESLLDKFVAEGADLYVANCARCHGPAGEGLGPMPPLNNASLATADHDVIYDTIAHSPHGTAMSAWHMDEGGALNSFQVEGLVTLIMTANWGQVGQLAAAKGFAAPTPAVPEVQLATMEATGEDPHECRACHEEPTVHADRFGLNCSRCHTLQAWKPALLTRHTFLLDHGGEGKLPCQTCHTETYSDHTCYGCHDHEPGEMEVVHVQEEIDDFELCVECHPTGVEGEAASLGYGRSGQGTQTESSDDLGATADPAEDHSSQQAGNPAAGR
jgi:mono/diheme cytochrome c family protein